MRQKRFDVIDILVVALISACITFSATCAWFNTLCLAVREPVEVSAVTDVSPIVYEEETSESFVEAVTEVSESVVEYEKLYTDEDAIVLAKMVWGEARGVGDLETKNGIVSGDIQREAVVWVALNRYDAGYSDSIVGVVTAPKQFSGYKESCPVDPELLDLVYNVLGKWSAEKQGAEDVGRVIPSGYLWFHGDGKHNWFRDAYRGADGYWEWDYCVETYVA